MPKPPKKSALRGIILIMTAFTVLLLVGFTLLHAQQQGEIMDLVITSAGREVIAAAEQIRTSDDKEALLSLADAMNLDFDLHSMIYFRGTHLFRPYAVVKIYDQDDQLVAMESAGGNPKRLARLEAKADDNKRNWSFSGWAVTHGTDIFSSKWHEATHTAMEDEITAWYEANPPEDTSQWVHMDGNTISYDAEHFEFFQAMQKAMEEDFRASGYLYYTFAAEGYPLLVTLQKMLPVYFLAACLLLCAILLMRKKLTAVPAIPPEDAQAPDPNPTAEE